VSQPRQKDGDVVVTLVGEEATVKRFFKKGRKIELKPDNERWETIQIEEGSGEIQILGKSHRGLQESLNSVLSYEF